MVFSRMGIQLITKIIISASAMCLHLYGVYFVDHFVCCFNFENLFFLFVFTLFLIEVFVASIISYFSLLVLLYLILLYFILFDFF